MSSSVCENGWFVSIVAGGISLHDTSNGSDGGFTLVTWHQAYNLGLQGERNSCTHVGDTSHKGLGRNGIGDVEAGGSHHGELTLFLNFIYTRHNERR